MNLDEKLEFRFYFRDWKDKLLLIISTNLPQIPFTKVFKSRRDYTIPSIEESFEDKSEVLRLLKIISKSLKNKNYIFSYSILLQKDINKDQLIKELCQWINLSDVEEAVNSDTCSLLGFLLRKFRIKNNLPFARYYLYLPRKDSKDLYHTKIVDMSKEKYINIEKSIAKNILNEAGGEILGHGSLAIYYDFILEL